VLNDHNVHHSFLSLFTLIYVLMKCRCGHKNPNLRGPIRVELSNETVALLEHGKVLAYPNSWDDNSLIPGNQLLTTPSPYHVEGSEATRLLLWDIVVTGEDAASGSGSSTSNSSSKPWDTLASYQIMADKAAQKEFGPPRR
jgi:hypothetical protein